jgi:hypothetical protein
MQELQERLAALQAKESEYQAVVHVDRGWLLVHDRGAHNFIRT